MICSKCKYFISPIGITENCREIGFCNKCNLKTISEETVSDFPIEKLGFLRLLQNIFYSHKTEKTYEKMKNRIKEFDKEI